MLEGLLLYLLEHPDVRAVLDDRVFPQKAPQGMASPYVTCRRTASLPGRHLKGSDGLDFTAVEITAHGTSYDEADQAAAAVRAAIGKHGYTGSWNGRRIQLAYLSNAAGDYTPPWAADDVGMHEITLDLEVRHQPD